MALAVNVDRDTDHVSPGLVGPSPASGNSHMLVQQVADAAPALSGLTRYRATLDAGAEPATVARWITETEALTGGCASEEVELQGLGLCGPHGSVVVERGLVVCPVSKDHEGVGLGLGS
jgi:hypothetical protein